MAGGSTWRKTAALVSVLGIALWLTGAGAANAAVVVLFEDNIDVAPVCASGVQCTLTATEFPIPRVALSGEGSLLDVP